MITVSILDIPYQLICWTVKPVIYRRSNNAVLHCCGTGRPGRLSTLSQRWLMTTLQRFNRPITLKLSGSK
jgi:hypothetical protein